jgi:transglutaminase-like putative cysteine protease
MLNLLLGALLAFVVSIVEAPPIESGVADSTPALLRLLREDFATFSTDIAPIPAGTGHLLALGVLIWVLAAFASTAAIRLRSPVQGAMPHVVAILGLGLVAREEGRMLASVALLVALGVYCVTQAAWRNAGLRWLPRPREGITAPIRWGAGLLAVSAVAALVLAPLLPGGPDPVLDYRSGDLVGGRQDVVSPFVDVGSNLGPRSSELMFTVRSERASYWRLTALDEYDPTSGIWVLSNSYEPVDGPIREPVPEDAVETRIAIRELGGFWVPSVDELVTAKSEQDLGWDADAGSLILRGGDLTDGDEVVLASEPFEPAVQTLQEATVPPKRSVKPMLLSEDGIPVNLRVAARDVGGDMAPYEAALALQNWFREEFTYDQTVDLSDAEDPMSVFLTMRRGFCQQFASAFALAARALGIPSRVVVGFTTGNPTPDSAYAVYGRNAHAWPEILLEGIGWVAFEPTPGRGNPATTATTGVPGQQAPPPEGTTEETAPTTTSTIAAPAPGGVPTTAPPRSNDVEAGTADPGRSRRAELIMGSIVAALAIALVVATFRIRRHLARRRGGPSEEHLVAWDEALSLLEPRGLHLSDRETPVEFAGRVRTRLGTEAIVDLAAVESKRRWSSEPLDATDLERADDAVGRLERFLVEGPSAELQKTP